jgi:hypothetical protein
MSPRHGGARHDNGKSRHYNFQRLSVPQAAVEKTKVDNAVNKPSGNPIAMPIA